MLKSIAIASVLVLSTSAAAQTTLKLATQVPDGTSWMQSFRAAADTIEARTEGRVKLKFYPGGVMGNDATVMKKIRIGQLHGAALTGGELATIVPDIKLYSLPFLFRNAQEVKFVRERLDPILRERADAAGFALVGLSGGGFAKLVTREEIRSLDDLRKLDIWLPQGDQEAQIAFEIADLSAVQLPMSDVYTSLQTGLIDSVAATPTGIIAFQWHTKVKYMVDLPLSYLMGTFVFANRALDRLDEADRAVVVDVVGTLFNDLTRSNREDNEKAVEALQAQGIEIITLAPGDAAQLNSIGEKTIRRLMAGEGESGFEHLQTVLDLIDEFRAGQGDAATTVRQASE